MPGRGTVPSQQLRLTAKGQEMYIHADGSGFLGTYCGSHGLGVFPPRSWRQYRTGMPLIRSKVSDSLLALSDIIADLLKVCRSGRAPGGPDEPPLCGRTGNKQHSRP